VENDLIPAGIRTRLHVSITDPDWKERIKSAAEGRMPSIDSQRIEPFTHQVHTNPFDVSKFVIEVRPRAGTWIPFFARIPISEKDLVNPDLSIGARGRIPEYSYLTLYEEGINLDGNWWLMTSGDEATPTKSYFIYVDALPSIIIFGVPGEKMQYQVRFR